MKKTQLFGATLLSVMALGALQTTTFAAETVTQTLSPTAGVQFIPDDSTTPPVDPENPDPTDPVDPTDPETGGPDEPGGNKGPLSLDYASKLYFGVNKISSQDKVYFANAQTFQYKPDAKPVYAQVTDNTGELAGWSLTVKQNGQFKTAEGDELKGATITFDKGHSETKVDASENPADKVLDFIKADQFVLAADGSGDAVKVLEASKGQGAGTYTYYNGSTTDGDIVEGTDYEKDQDGNLVLDQDVNPTEKKVMKDKAVFLSVPGASTKLAKKYSTTLTWTLSNVPTDEEGTNPEA